VNQAFDPVNWFALKFPSGMRFEADGVAVIEVFDVDVGTHGFLIDRKLDFAVDFTSIFSSLDIIL
jgi:hypothetical protein